MRESACNATQLVTLAASLFHSEVENELRNVSEVTSREIEMHIQDIAAKDGALDKKDAEIKRSEEAFSRLHTERGMRTSSHARATHLRLSEQIIYLPHRRRLV